MIEEYGTVVERKGKSVAAVLCKKSSMCEHCASAGLCHMGDDNRSMVVDAQNALGAEVGDKVKIVTSTKSFLQSSFILYIVPLIGLVIGAVAGQLIGEYFNLKLNHSLLSALIGTAFLVGSFMIIRVGSKAIPREAFMPRIVEILHEEAP